MVVTTVANMFLTPGSGLGIFTDRDQQSIFFWGGGGVEFRKSIFLGVWVIVAVFLGCQINYVFLRVLPV